MTRSIRVGPLLLALAVVASLGLAVVVLARPASAAGPTVSLEPDRAAPGDRVRVQLRDWPPGPVALSVCGNDALRGDQDCALRETEAVANTGGETLFDLLVAVPPMPCPCVVRAFNAGNALVRTVPIAVDGVVVAPTIAADPASVQSVAVTASVEVDRRGGLSSLRSALGGPAHRVLVLTVRNTGNAVVSGLSLSAAIGRETQGGEPLVVPELEPLPPGASQAYDIPFTLSAPSWGSYVVSGTVYGPGAPATFEAGTSASPTLLGVAVFGLVATTLAVVVLRGRRRARIRRAWRQQRRELDARRTLAEQLAIDPGSGL